MTVPSTMADLSTTASSNSPSGSDAANTIDDNIRAAFAIMRGMSFKGSDIASNSSITPNAAGSLFKVTGTNTVAGIASTNSHPGRIVYFWHTGTQAWTHSSTLRFADGASHTFVNGDMSAWHDTDGAGTWQCVGIEAATTQTANLTLGSGGKIISNFHASANSRPAFQATAGQTSTNLDIIPPASTGTSSSFQVYDNSDRSIADYLQFFVGTSFGSVKTQGVPMLLGANGLQWTMDTSGRFYNSTASQTSFRATRTSTNQNSGTGCIFNTANTNTGSAYNATTGVFTAPVTGVYLFSATIGLNNTSGSTITNVAPVIQNGSVIIAKFGRDLPDSTTFLWNLCGIGFLTANDNVNISAGTFDSTFVMATNSVFCGALLF